MLLQDIKLELGLSDTSKDDLLTMYITDVTDDILEITNQAEVIPTIERIVKDIVIIRYNRRGSEGLASESMAGVGQTYLDDLPKTVLRRIRSIRKVRW